MEIVTRYRAIDGREFPCEEQCIDWEQWLEDLDAANTMLANGATVWDAMCRAKVRCGYDWSTVCRKQWMAALSGLTRSTKLVISHWQCRDTPGYSPIRILPNERLWVAGDAGSWSGPYGREVEIRDLARYANDNGIGVEKAGE